MCCSNGRPPHSKIIDEDGPCSLLGRLRATGVVNVENPVRTALEEGKLEHLDGRARIQEIKETEAEKRR